MKVILAIPNYNGADNITHLVDAALKQTFDAIYVLDDASTDDSLKLLEAYEDQITLVKGDTNLGAGGNRNRMTNYVKDGVIYFLDADMEIQTVDLRERAERYFEDKQIGMIGGCTLNKKGQWMHWNFGRLMLPGKDFLTGMVYGWSYSRGGKGWIKWLNRLIRPYSYSWDRSGVEDKVLPVQWVAEGNFAIRAELFAKVGGFDQRMRYHEAHDLGRKVIRAGFKSIFCPDLVARHLEIDVRGVYRAGEKVKSRYYFYLKRLLRLR